MKRGLILTASAVSLLVAMLSLVPARLRSVFVVNRSTVEWLTVSPGSMRFWVEATGTLKASSLQAFGGPPAFGQYWQFQIISMVPEGQAVHPGDLLIGFDAQRVRDDLQRFENELNQAVKELEKTKAEIDLEEQNLAAKLAEAENKYEKLKLKQASVPDLLASGTIEADRLAMEQARREASARRERIKWHQKSSQATYKIIESKKSRAENKVSEIIQGLENFQAKAGRDGVVIYNLKWNGERFQVGETVWSGQPVLEIPDLSTIAVEALVPEVDIGKVQAGQRAEVTIDAFPGRSYLGTVRTIGKLIHPKAWDIQNKILDVQIVLDKLDTSVMRPGMSIRARIEAGSVSNMIVAPLKAVHILVSGASVKVKTDSGWNERNVKLGESNGSDVVVTEGLRAGDRIAANYAGVK